MTDHIQPPHSIQAEQALLGALLVNNNRLDDIQEIDASHFFEPAHLGQVKTTKE